MQRDLVLHTPMDWRTNGGPSFLAFIVGVAATAAATAAAAFSGEQLYAGIGVFK